MKVKLHQFILPWMLLLTCTTSAVQTQGRCALQIVRGGGPHTTLSQHLFHNILNIPTVGSVCITHDDVEVAFYAAMTKTNSPLPEGKLIPPKIGQIGNIITEITRIISVQHSLTPEEVALHLPLLDTTRTSISQICPAYASPMKCTPGKYRRFDGLCNNLKNPTWGAVNAVFSRFLPHDFADGVSAPRVSSVRGGKLPNARVVSAMIHRDEGFHDHAATTFLIAWGQLMDHDFTLTATPLDRRTKNELEECCNRPPNGRDPHCMPIEIPRDDKFYSLFRFTCLDFTRGFQGLRQNCKLGPRSAFNTLTGVIDGNTVYGGNDRAARELRMGVGGLLRHYDAFPGMPLKPMLPLKTDIPDEGCIRETPSQRCFLAGEIRVNEQLILTCAHILMMREHNRLAESLAHLNPHWDDERLYQEARRIVAAQIQHVTYNEFLPQLLGRDVMQKFGLLLETNGYWDGYDETVDPSISASFSSAAFRFGHSLLPSAIERWSPSHKFIASKLLHKTIRQPYELFRPGVLDEFFLGMLNQPAQAMDDAITQEVTNFLFAEQDQDFGFDLVAFNIQRAREFGVPGYGAWRQYCGLRPILSFADLAAEMTNNTALQYSQIYSSVDDIDLWSAGVSERPLPGSLLGPTFSCIIATQMQRLRKGDRYWYELPGQPSSFTPKQLHSIRQTRLFRLLCDNTDNIETAQVYPFVLPDHRINPRMPCKSSILPQIDLTPWIEVPQGIPSGVPVGIPPAVLKVLPHVIPPIPLIPDIL
ncbi:peroxidase-like isoform X2 [Palaemon carinicauda]